MSYYNGTSCLRFEKQLISNGSQCVNRWLRFIPSKTRINRCEETSAIQNQKKKKIPWSKARILLFSIGEVLLQFDSLETFDTLPLPPEKTFADSAKTLSRVLVHWSSGYNTKFRWKRKDIPLRSFTLPEFCSPEEYRFPARGNHLLFLRFI